MAPLAEAQDAVGSTSDELGLLPATLTPNDFMEAAPWSCEDIALQALPYSESAALFVRQIQNPP